MSYQKCVGDESKNRQNVAYTVQKVEVWPQSLGRIKLREDVNIFVDRAQISGTSGRREDQIQRSRVNL